MRKATNEESDGAEEEGRRERTTRNIRTIYAAESCGSVQDSQSLSELVCGVEG
jgi:hypothetical protein